MGGGGSERRQKVDKNSYDKKDAAKETESGGKETARAWHKARDDAQKSKDPYDRNLTKGWKRTPDEQDKKKK